MPWMWLVAGPNGSGKSTFAIGGALAALQGHPLKKLNADERARALRKLEPSLTVPDANLSAVNEIDACVSAMIEARESFVVETVLSTEKYKAPLLRAKTLGYSVGLIFVTLASPDLNVARVAFRVATGGHDVPTEKIIERYDKALRKSTVVRLQCRCGQGVRQYGSW